MREQQPIVLDEHMQQAVDELQSTILGKYPAAHFELSRSPDDPRMIHLDTTVDLDDAGEVLDLVLDRLVELQVEQGIPIHVIPIRTPERVAASLQAGPARRRTMRRRRTFPLLGKLPS